MTVAELMEALDGLPGDYVVMDSYTGRPVVAGGVITDIENKEVWL